MTYWYNIFWLMMCSHLMGDFFLQPPSLSEKKKISYAYLLLHGAIYAVGVFALISPIINLNLAIMAAILSLSHLLIDILKIKIPGLNSDKCNTNPLKKYLFFIDQLLHIAIIAVLTYKFTNPNNISSNDWGNLLKQVYNSLPFAKSISVSNFVLMIFASLLLLKPANIIIKNVNPKEEKIFEDCQKPAGCNIGIFERIIIFFLVISQQYAAIAVVFAAKSLTRYDKISKDQEFAEYYLIGTLLSVMIAMISGLLVRSIFVKL